MNEDFLARLRADADQARATLEELAGSMAAFYATLIAKGMPPDAALPMTMELLRQTIQSNSSAAMLEELINRFGDDDDD